LLKEDKTGMEETVGSPLKEAFENKSDVIHQ